MPIKDVKGQRFNRLLAHSYAGLNKHGAALWECLCDCGTKKVVAGHDLRSGHTRSCGCLVADVSASASMRHGHTCGSGRGAPKSPTYRTWRSMINRCYRPAEDSFRYYGGRGIAVCERWRNDFSAFLSDMGERPDGMTIGRIDAAGNYEPSNCRWETIYQQSANRGMHRNNTSGVKGVSWIQNRWRVSITRNGKKRYLGFYKDFNEARDVALRAYSLA